MVRVPFHGRRVAGWVIDADSRPPGSVRLQPIAKVSGEGPDADVIDLCRWAAWRWAGRLPTMLRVASPDRMLGRRPPVRPRPATGGDADPAAVEALAGGPGVTVLQVAPGADPAAVALAAARLGQALVVHPSVAAVDRIARSLRRTGAPVGRWPQDFAAAAGGATVVGGRPAVFAPLPALAAVVVFEEDDPGLQNESSPTWNAREVAVERARRAGVPCLLVSPCPSVVARAHADREVVAARGARHGWAPLVVVDRRDEDVGRSGLFSSRLVEAVRDTARAGSRVVCVLNRTGRARLLACRSCGTVTTCERCEAAVHLTDRLDLLCDRCEARRPSVCLVCGSTALSLLRPGVSRAREELEALVREPVGMVTAATPDDAVAAQRVVIGTSAVLFRTHGAGLVAFLDVDQELLGMGYRSAEEALRLLALASRAVAGARDGRVVVQTRRPDHVVLQAALHGDPARVSTVEAAKRSLLGFPPAATVAVIGGTAGPAFVERLGHPLGVEVQGPDERENWLARSEDRPVLLDALGAVDRPPGRLRLWVDPARTR
jgi:primosomal protein N' (replication factor Y)